MLSRQILNGKIKLEMSQADEAPKKKARIHLFKFQLILCGSAVVFTPLVLIPISVFFPR